MQVCTSPTFENIRKEMREYGDVPFGCNSPSALLRRGQMSVILMWSIFVITSLPIHLFLNGLTGYAIQAFPVQGRVVLKSDFNKSTDSYEQGWNPGFTFMTDCANQLAGAENWVTTFNNITIVVLNETKLEKYESFVTNWNTGSRETLGPPDPQDLDSCYVNAVIPKCSVTVRWFPLVVTTLAMMIKTATAYFALKKSRHFKYRLYNSLGDFIAVATRHREELSVPGECLANNGEYRKKRMRALKGGTGGIPLRAENRRQMYIRYLGFLDWVVWLFWIGSVAVLWFLVSKSLDAVSNDYRDERGDKITNALQLFSIAGFGRLSLSFVISNSGSATDLPGADTVSLPVQLAIANSPQLWLSMSYLLWNNQITRIWGEHEWRSYSGRRKRPRVSYGADVDGVKNTRWLQLPYFLSLILMGISTTMHWVVSQTLFVVEVENQSQLPHIHGQPAPDAIIFAICYSPTAIFVIAVIGIVLMLGITIYYILPFRSWMPFMAGSARVVFASCCALPKDLPEDGVMWGDVSDEWGRLAGFGENAKALKAGEIYPERYKRPLPADSPSDRPFTARTGNTYSSDTRDSYFERPFSSASRQSSYTKLSPSYDTLQYPNNTYEVTSSSRNPNIDSPQSPYSRNLAPVAVRPLNYPDVGRTLSSSTWASPTTIPQEDGQFGSGYQTTGFRQRFGLYHDTTENDSETEEVEWKGWGEARKSGDSNAPEQDWKGWGV